MPIAADVEPGISLELLLKKLDFIPHSVGQWEYIKSQARFNVPCCGRRWGKSIATGHRATYRMFKKDAFNWIIGPTYKLGEKEFRIIYNDFKKLGLLKYCKKSYSVTQGEMRIVTPWNTTLEVVSAEKPDNLLGEGLDYAVMSEAARHSRQTWEQFIEPALSDKRGSADFPSTPRGYNWFHGLHQLGINDTPGYTSYHFPSWTNTVRYPGGIDNEEIQRIKQTASKQYFDQEYGALFTTFTGQIYEEWDEALHTRHLEYNPLIPNYLAFDYGFANPFVCLDIQIGPDDTVYVWREYYERYQATYQHATNLSLRTNPQNYRIDGMWGDPTGADDAATIALVLGYVNSEVVPWKHGIEAVKRLLKNKPWPKLYVDKSCVNLIRQMQQLHIKEQLRKTASTQDLKENVSDGNIQHKVDDHAVDALRYFIGPYFVLGAGSHLSDVYDSPYEGSEAEDFFKLHSGVRLDSFVGY